jgi:hypothetical protein
VSEFSGIGLGEPFLRSGYWDAQDELFWGSSKPTDATMVPVTISLPVARRVRYYTMYFLYGSTAIHPKLELINEVDGS